MQSARSLFLFATSLGALLSSCGAETPSPRSAILVTIDTTRRDALSSFGGPAALTPHLDRLVQEGRAFDRAYTVAPLTLVAHASMLTGLYPPRHGVHYNNHSELSSAAVTLAESARAAGLQTAAFLSASVLHSKFGLAQGFETYEAPAKGRAQGTTHYAARSSDEVVDAAIRWLRERDQDRGSLVWVHLWDPHAPYEPAASFARANPYHGEVQAMDAALGRLLDYLRQDSAWEQTTVLVVSDHGEAFGEHQEWTHGSFCFESTMTIPMILRAPGIASGSRSDDLVSVVDVAPTLAAALGLKSFPESVDGRNLLELVPTDRGVYMESYQAYFTLGWSPTWGWVNRQWKYLDAGTPYLFELAADPGELENLAPGEVEVVHKFRGDIQQLFDLPALPTQLVQGQDEELLQAIQALGYAQAGEWGAEPPAPFVSSGLIDPFGRTEDLTDQSNLNALWANGQFRKAESLLRKLVANNPDGVRNRDKLGAVLVRFGKEEEAVPHLLTVIVRGGATDLTYGNLASCYLKAGKARLAINALKLALSMKPDHADYRGALVQTLRQQNAPAEANHFDRGGAPQDAYAPGLIQ